ncbi:maleylpyruvate isomerase family mycothiol-dependent enzyme [Streptomyces boninensis]|uniref:maleylpyruvate isomerase family mycothiol-dependent enzyme n=1 Tax=Streptomyces boninensis TaxID=2039455 RepID=UPI003B21986D
MAKTTPRTSPAIDLTSEIAAERRELADLFDGLTPAQWDAPSLCAGWRVREVAAHMSMGFRLSLPATLAQLLRSAGRLHRMTDRVARRDAAAHSPTELATFLRDNANHPWTPPVGGLPAALGHDVVHGLDITVALGLDRQVPAPRLQAVLAETRPRGLKFFGADLTGVHLQADDLDWSYGTGAPLHGSAQSLLLLTFGRKLPPGHLRGERSDRYTR